MPIKTDVYLQIGLSKEVFKKFKKLKKLEEWQQKYTLIIFKGGYTNEVSQLLDMLENEILPLYTENQSGYRGNLYDDIDTLYEYIEYPSNRNVLDWIEIYGH